VTDRRDVTAIVLAGGRSTRFGGSKLDMLVAGERLLVRALRAVSTVAAQIVVAGPPLSGDIMHAGPAGPIPATIRFVPDDEPFAGPLSAIAGVLATLTTELALVVGGDMPGLVPAVLESILDRLTVSSDVDAVLLAAPQASDEAPKPQILPLALRVGPASSAAADALGEGDRSLIRLLGRLRSIELPAREWLALDPAGETLLDVDFPADLERFRARDLQ
jgi:molybdopterin-guanine dinucleotide biosynthesis protein A